MQQNKISSPPKIVGIWLLSGAVIVLAMVILGGYTRLSHSGLSIVSWKPVTGVLPPLNHQEWVAEFEAYQATPEFKFRNYHFTLTEFKQIYWPEYYHRLLGRTIAFLFLIPFIYFLWKGYFKSKKIIRHLIILFALGLLQGLIGWYMVKSGLVDMPAVSHLRLALHFSAALLLYSYLIWVALPILFPTINNEVFNFPKLKRLSIFLFGVLIIQIIYGAFVAGLKAGLIFPTFPKMGDEWVPHILSAEFERSKIMALINSPYVVQFIHRWLGVAVVVGILYFYLQMRIKQSSKLLRTLSSLILIIVLIQFTLGVLTLINLVPISLGVIHQLVAVLLFTLFLVMIKFFSLAKPT